MLNKLTIWQGLTMTLLIFLSACSPTFFPFVDMADEGREGAATRETARSNPGNEAASKMTGAFAPEQALRQLYGNFDTETQRARWQPTREELQQLGFSPNTKMAYTRLLFAKSFVERNQERYVLLLKTLPTLEDCRGCNPAIGGALYTKAAGVWQLDSQRVCLTKVGAFDRVSQAKLVQIGPDKQGVLFHWKFFNLGFTEEGAVLLAEGHAGLQEMLVLNTGGSNEERCDAANGVFDTTGCWAYRAKLEFVPGSHATYYDLQVTTTGSKPNADGEVLRFNEKKVYVFEAGVYRLQTKLRR